MSVNFVKMAGNGAIYENQFIWCFMLKNREIRTNIGTIVA